MQKLIDVQKFNTYHLTSQLATILLFKSANIFKHLKDHIDPIAYNDIINIFDQLSVLLVENGYLMHQNKNTKEQQPQPVQQKPIEQIKKPLYNDNVFQFKKRGIDESK